MCVLDDAAVRPERHKERKKKKSFSRHQTTSWRLEKEKKNTTYTRLWLSFPGRFSYLIYAPSRARGIIS